MLVPEYEELEVSCLDFIWEERPSEARGRVSTEEERAARREDDPAGDGLQVVAGDAPAGALLPLPQQLLLFAVKLVLVSDHAGLVVLVCHYYLTGPGIT